MNLRLRAPIKILTDITKVFMKRSKIYSSQSPITQHITAHHTAQYRCAVYLKVELFIAVEDQHEPAQLVAQSLH